MPKKDEKFFDVRVSNRYIKEGMLTKKEYDSFIKNLPDIEDKSEPLIIEDEKTEIEENTELVEDE